MKAKYYSHHLRGERVSIKLYAETVFIPIWFRSCYAVGGTLLKTNFNSHSYTLPQDITASFLSFNLILWLYPQKQNVCVVKEMGCFPMETFAIFFCFFPLKIKWCRTE